MQKVARSTFLFCYVSSKKGAKAKLDGSAELQVSGKKNRRIECLKLKIAKVSNKDGRASMVDRDIPVTDGFGGAKLEYDRLPPPVYDDVYLAAMEGSIKPSIICGFGAGAMEWRYVYDRCRGLKTE